MKILFIAGWAHDSSAMESLANKFSDIDTELTSVHELITESSLELSIESYAKSLEEKLKKYDELPVVIGWSMGAMVLLEVLAFNPRLIKKAVLISGTLKFCNLEEYDYGIDIRNVKALKMGLRRSVDSTLKTFFADCYKPIDMGDELLKQRIKKAKEMGTESLSCGLEYLLKKDLRKIKIDSSISILSIHGKEDQIVPFSAGEYLNKNINDSEFICIPKGNHDIINSEIDSVYLNIKKFIYNE